MLVRKCFFMVTALLIFGSVTIAQTPTPLPGTPLALTCDPFTFLPGISSVEVITNWNDLDRACIVLENTTGGAIAIAGFHGYFAQTEYPLIAQLRIWEVVNEDLLPDLYDAAILVSEGTYDVGADPVPGNPQIALVTCDLENYPGLSMPVINPGKKFVVDIINVHPDDPYCMKITAEWDESQCPPAYWSNETNIFGDQVGGTLNWFFKEDIGNATNFYMGVTYYDNVDPRTPAMGTIGLVSLLVIVSFALTMKRKSGS
jgi:hypothetical protein